MNQKLAKKARKEAEKLAQFELEQLREEDMKLVAQGYKVYINGLSFMERIKLCLKILIKKF
jgi:hypothetical protein